MHVFHRDCIWRWNKRNKNCPVCRKEVKAYFEWEPEFLIRDKDGNLIDEEGNIIEEEKGEQGIIVENVEEEDIESTKKPKKRKKYPNIISLVKIKTKVRKIKIKHK